MHQDDKRGARKYQVFLDNDHEKSRRQICEIIMAAEELGECPRATRKRRRDSERADRYRRNARNCDLITLQYIYIEDSLRDNKKGSEKSKEQE